MDPEVETADATAPAGGPGAPAPVPTAAVPPGRVREVALLFLRLGFTAFGGPAAHVAMMEDEVVRRRGWLDRQHFLDLVAALNFIPGPNSTELAIHLGLIRAGWRGLVAAGVCFITPAVLIVLPLAWAYVRFGGVPRVEGMMRGIGAAVVAIVAVAGWRFARTGVRDRFTLAVAVATVPAELLLRRHTSLQSELVILAAAALLGAWWYRRPATTGASPALVLPLPLAALPTTAPTTAALLPGMGEVAWFFLKVGATLFGSGYVLVSYLRTGLVDQTGWLTDRELLDAVAVGQVTPGPLLTTATFVGYLLAHKAAGGAGAAVAGGVVATIAIFLPSFVLVALVGRVLPRLRRKPIARAALDGMNAAVAALILVVAARYAWDLRHDPLSLGLAAVALAALLRWDVNATWLIAGASVLGLFFGRAPGTWAG